MILWSFGCLLTYFNIFSIGIKIPKWNEGILLLVDEMKALHMLHKVFLPYLLCYTRNTLCSSFFAPCFSFFALGSTAPYFSQQPSFSCTENHRFLSLRRIQTLTNALFVSTLTFSEKMFIFQRAFSRKLSHFLVFGNDFENELENVFWCLVYKFFKMFLV